MNDKEKKTAFKEHPYGIRHHIEIIEKFDNKCGANNRKPRGEFTIAWEGQKRIPARFPKLAESPNWLTACLAMAGTYGKINSKFAKISELESVLIATLLLNGNEPDRKSGDKIGILDLKEGQGWAVLPHPDDPKKDLKPVKDLTPVFEAAFKAGLDPKELLNAITDAGKDGSWHKWVKDYIANPKSAVNSENNASHDDDISRDYEKEGDIQNGFTEPGQFQPELFFPIPEEYSLPNSTSQIQDIIDLFDQPDDSPTTKKQLIQARLGQGKFKEDVIKIWGLGKRCAVTGIDIPQLLIASHIIPWRESEELRLDGKNGILLCSHLDKLFDQHLISFNDKGQLVPSNRLSKSDWQYLETIGIHQSLQLNMTALTDGDKTFIKENLKRHRQRLVDLDQPA